MKQGIGAVMVTANREPGENYLEGTLRSLKQSDLLTAGVPLALVDGRGGGWAKDVTAAVGLSSLVVIDDHGPANLNVASALRVAAAFDREWVLFLEDDIAVCADFFGSVQQWLSDFAVDDRRIYAFGCPYLGVNCGLGSFDYPISDFYGTQAIALRNADALTVARYLEIHCYDREDDGTCYDLLMFDWCRLEYPKLKHFLASRPSFVEHTGRTSIIRPRPETHKFKSWPGPDWSYLSAKAVAS